VGCQGGVVVTLFTCIEYKIGFLMLRYSVSM